MEAKQEEVPGHNTHVWQPLSRNEIAAVLVDFADEFQILQKSKFDKSDNFEIGLLNLAGAGFEIEARTGLMKISGLSSNNDQ